MPAGRQFQPGDFARNPDILELGLQRRADGRVQLANGIDAPLGGQVEFQRELLHGAMVTAAVCSQRARFVPRPV